MRSVSDVLQKSGGTVEYQTRDGRKVRISSLTLRHMSEYETRLQNKAIRTLAAQRGVLPDDVWKTMFTELMAGVSKGVYAFGGEVCQSSLGTIGGVVDLMSILCDVTPEEAMDLVANEGDGFRQVFDRVVRDSVSGPDDVPSSAAEAEAEKNG